MQDASIMNEFCICLTHDSKSSIEYVAVHCDFMWHTHECIRWNLKDHITWGPNIFRWQLRCCLFLSLFFLKMNLPCDLPPTSSQLLARKHHRQIAIIQASQNCHTPGRTNGTSSEAMIHVIPGMCIRGHRGMTPQKRRLQMWLLLYDNQPAPDF